VALIWAGATALDAFLILTTATEEGGTPIPFFWRLRCVLVAQLGPYSGRAEGGCDALVPGLSLRVAILLTILFRSWIFAWIAFVIVVLFWHIIALAIRGSSIA
jgi:hypothetical protein